MKIILLAMILTISPILQAMDTKESYKPAIPMTNPTTGEGYLASMPVENKVQIMMAIRTADSLEQAVQAIRALAASNKDFNTIINDAKTTKDIIHMLVAQFGGYHETVAKALATQGAQQYIKNNMPRAINDLEDAKEYLQTADVHYLNAQGQSLGLLYDDKVAQYWIEHGLDINTVNPGGYTLAGSLIGKWPNISLDMLRVLIKNMNPEVIDLPIAPHMTLLDGIVPRALNTQAPANENQEDWYTILKLAIDKGALNNIAVSLDLVRQTLNVDPNNKFILRLLALLEQAEKNQMAKKQ